MTRNRLATTTLILVSAAAALVAQAPATPTPIMTEKSSGTGPLNRLSFRAIGPATPSGRVDDLAVLESDPTTFYVAMATSGIYKTTNGGTTFTNVFDNETTSSVGAVAIAQTDANLVWAGTGEGNNRQSSSWGEGVFKSTDGGRTWKNMGCASTQNLESDRRPVDFSVVYVAALGICGRPAASAASSRPPTAASPGTAAVRGRRHRRDRVGDGSVRTQGRCTPRRISVAAQQWGINGGGPGSAIRSRATPARRGRGSRAEFRPAPRADRPRRLPRTERALRAHRARERGRRVPVGRRRGELEENEQRGPAPMYFSHD